MLTIDNLRAKLSASLKGWRPKMEKAGIATSYALLSAYSLFPVLLAYQQGLYASEGLLALGALLGSLGVNVFSTQLTDLLKKWQSEIKTEEELAHQIESLPSDSPLRADLDSILEKLDAVDLARNALSGADKDWFTQTLHEELRRFGHFKTYSARIEGDYNVLVQGDGNIINVKHETHYHAAPDPADAESHKLAAARTRYLTALRRFCSFLPLAAISADESSDEDVTLDDVYVELNTTSQVPLSDNELNEDGEPHSERRWRTMTAVEAATREKRLVLLGNPGSGKSAFVYRWLANLADAHLGQRDLPAWATPAMLPILLTLRDIIEQLGIVATEDQPDDRRREALAAIARDQMVKDLARYDAPDFAEGLRTALRTGECLLALDGLDEVPQHLRALAKDTVLALLAAYPVRRMILTCRIRSYTGNTRLEHFDSYTLAEFTPDQIQSFASAWYNTQRRLNRLTDEQARDKANDLGQAAVDRDLIELSSNPMLLTTLASIHQREATLPRERVRLYDAAVRNLLFRWQKSKLKMSPALARFVDSNEIRDAMELLAFHAHSAGQKDKEAADLSRGQAFELLEKVLKDLDAVNEFLQYVDYRAGLLIGSGSKPDQPESYRFPHRTFQEYLAGCYLAGQTHPHRRCYPLAADGDYWSLAVQLGAEELYFTRRLPPATLELAYRLGDREPATEQDRRAILWSGNIAMLLGREKVAEDHDYSEVYLHRLLPHLVGLLSSDLSAPERAEAGRALAKLGDPRAEVMTVDGMRFCLVPAGPFLMGTRKADIPKLIARFGGPSDWYEDETDQQEIHLPYDYCLAEYPVSNAQFTEFVAEGGYGVAAYWEEAQTAGHWDETGYKSRWDNTPLNVPVSYVEQFNLSNHPVVGISRYVALAYTRWLTERWHEKDWLPDDWQITLPSETEWEKGARGGSHLPRTVLPQLITQLATLSQTELIPSALHSWKYPWGDDFNANLANTNKTGIGTTSALGSYAIGQSVLGLQDISGNVWEWTRSLSQSYPYPNSEMGRRRREDLSAGTDQSRVLRGGSFGNGAKNARCACRDELKPYGRFNDLGFRVMASPILSRV